MAKFQIEVEEILQRVVDVEADSLEEALDKVDEQYHSEEIVLDYEDHKGTEIREYRDCISMDDLKISDFFDVKHGKAFLLEKNGDVSLFKLLNNSEYPYVVATGIKPEPNKTYFEWDQGNYYKSISDANQKYQKLGGNIIQYGEERDFKLKDTNISLNMQTQLNQLKSQLQLCNEKEFDELENKYFVFKNIMNTLDEELIEIDKYKDLLESDKDIFEKIYDKFQKIDIPFDTPKFDETILESLLDEISKEREEELEL